MNENEPIMTKNENHSSKPTLKRPQSAYISKAKPTFIHIKSKSFKGELPVKEMALVTLRKGYLKDNSEVSPLSTMASHVEWKKMFTPRTSGAQTPSVKTSISRPSSAIKYNKLDKDFTIPNYKINAISLYRSLKKIKEQNNRDEISPQTLNPPILNEKTVNKLKRNPTSESILRLNSNNPNTMSFKCLEIMKKERYSSQSK